MNLINITSLYGYDFLFEKMELDSRLDRDTVINSIMDYNGEFIPMYPEGALFQNKIGTWSLRIKDGITRMLDALTSEYNPIENTDRYDEWTETTDSESAGTNKQNVSRETGNTRNEDYTENTDDTTETSVSAYDSSRYTPKDKTTLDSSKTNTGVVTDSGNVSENTSGNNSRTGKETKTYSQHLHGNIGVTSNQQMIREELDLRKFNIYTYIAEDFFDNFMIGVIE